MSLPAWPRRLARTIREATLDAATRSRGVPRTVNGLSVRVQSRTRHQFSGDYDAAVASFLKARINPGSEVWNIGANVGVYVLQLAAWVGPQGRVIAYEPNPETARRLVENVRLSGFADRVDIRVQAIAGTAGAADLYVRGTDGMSRLGRPNPALESTAAISVAVTTLDEVVRSRGACPRWVVMDIEGWEIAALQAARDLLGKSRFVVELHPSAWPWSGHSRADLEQLLRESGLEAVPLTGQADPLGEHGHVFVDARTD